MLLRYIFLSCLVAACLADLPIHCLFWEVEGTWNFYETDRIGNNSLTCDTFNETVHNKTFTLEYPNMATDEWGNTGTWTLMYDEGFEVRINERSYFAYFNYKKDDEGGYSVSYCHQTLTGWSRDSTNRNWACFVGEKTTQVPAKTMQIKKPFDAPETGYRNDPKQIEKINQAQDSWWAKAYPEHERYTLQQMYKRAGGAPTSRNEYPQPAAVTMDQQTKLDFLPEEFDWRDVDGVNYVSPVRDQEQCGSCYAFASMGMLEAHLRIATRNQRQDIFSTQDVLSCSHLAQGCNGGFSFLTAGRQAFEQGVVSEKCNPYLGKDETCDTDMSCDRTYVSDYGYVGGYYGGSNEVEMMYALVNNGPVAVGMMVTDDFMNYAGGIYHYTGLQNGYNPFKAVNHAVLVVGYGKNATSGDDFWIVKNSWGKNWGEDGYFRIQKGTNENAIESIAMQSQIIP